MPYFSRFSLCRLFLLRLSRRKNIARRSPLALGTNPRLLRVLTLRPSLQIQTVLFHLRSSATLVVLPLFVGIRIGSVIRSPAKLFTKVFQLVWFALLALSSSIKCVSPMAIAQLGWSEPRAALAHAKKEPHPIQILACAFLMASARNSKVPPSASPSLPTMDPRVPAPSVA